MPMKFFIDQFTLKADFVKMREKLGKIDWRSELDVLDATNSWNHFKETVSSTVDACVPRKKRRNNSKPLWMQRNAMRTIRKKRRAWKQYCTTRDYQSYLAYKRVQNEIRKAKPMGSKYYFFQRLLKILLFFFDYTIYKPEMYEPES